MRQKQTVHPVRSEFSKENNINCNNYTLGATTMIDYDALYHSHCHVRALHSLILSALPFRAASRASKPFLLMAF